MLKNFIKQLTIWSLPFLALGISYFVFDPFHVLYRYKFYGSNFKKSYNRNRISTDTFLNYNPTRRFDSFIFGSSRSSAFLTQQWSPFIGSQAVFHFDAFNDNASGVLGKMKFINKQGNTLKNVLIIIDEDTFINDYDDRESIVHLKDYRWTDMNFLDYHLRFFKSYFKSQFFVSFLDLKLFDTYRPYMSDFFNAKFFFDTPDNNFLFPENEAQIKADSLKYFSEKVFKERKVYTKPIESKIDQNFLQIISQIDSLLQANKSHYKIIIAPKFDQTPYNFKDLETLKLVFGPQNVYNFSGKNNYSEPLWHFYEGSHFRPSVGHSILKEVYE
jgi:hypothetical protein